MIRSLVAFFVLSAVIGLAFLMEGGRVNVLLHPLIPTIVMISLSIGLAAFFLFSKEVRQRALKDLKEGQATTPASVAVWRLLERASYGAGVLALLLGLIITAGFLDQPPHIVGGKVGACLTMLAYGILQGMAMAMLRARVEAGLTALAVRSPQAPAPPHGLQVKRPAARRRG